MKRSKFRLLTVCFVIVALAVFADSLNAQGNGNGNGNGNGGGGGGNPPPDPAPVQYAVEWILIPPESKGFWVNELKVVTDSGGNPIDALLLGWYERTDRIGRSAFVYDHFGLIDRSQPRRFWDIQELVGNFPPAWAPQTATESGFEGWSPTITNNLGLISGYVSSDTNTLDRQGFYLDLNSGQLELLPIPAPALPTVGWLGDQVTTSGDILVKNFPTGSSAQTEVYIFNPETNEQIDVTDESNVPIVFNYASTIRLNALRDVIGRRAADNVFIRHSLVTQQTYEFLNLNTVRDINNVGQIVGDIFIPRGKNNGFRAIRADSVGTPDWTSSEKHTTAWEVNLDGDVLFGWDGDKYFHDGLNQVINVRDVIVESSDPNSVFRNSSELGNPQLSDIDDTGFGWLGGRVEVPQPDGSIYKQPVLLIPEILP